MVKEHGMVQPEIGEFVRLLDLLARVNDANEGFSTGDIDDGERLWSAHNLANKFIAHTLTILHLSQGIIVQDLPSFPEHRFTDTASINVLTRAAIEAFLVFHYVFSAPSTAEEKDYRYWCYEAAGLAERQAFPTITEEGRQTLDNEKIELDELRNKLDSNTVSQSLTPKQKRRILRGEWKLGKWHEIAIDAGFSKVLASHMYSFLCGYVHSSSVSVLQTTQVLLNKETERLIRVSIYIMDIVTANMIQEYCGLFSKAQDVLSKDLNGNNLVGRFIQIGRTLDKYMNIG